MTIALYPGGFDPITNGHLDIVQRAAGMFDEVVMAIYPRSSETFDVDERLAMIEGATAHCPNVRAAKFTGLVVNFADEVGASVLVRGIRAVTGFEAEFDMALMNKKMAPHIESVFLMAGHEHLFISASRIRELASLKQVVDDLVPPNVNEALIQRYGPPQR
ncbi:MAG: pantetheine-phosphate adenylyltransferase [Chloroflexota bacterium]|nr:pantetheine-phosphate adenylyltransferase [Chloroflexota bacterium]